MGMYSTITNKYSPQPCTNCNKINVAGQWWYLGNYFGISGYFCPKCNNLVSHNSYGIPNYPEQYELIKNKQSKQP